ncbi:MAG: hypothetical protein WCE21_04785 [Candidatus Babeliales bacterium]
MKKENIYVTVDSRNRVTIPKEMAKDLSHLYRIRIKNEQIILDPIKEIPKEEQWLFEPKNKHLLDELKKALKQKANLKINLDDLEKE